MLIELVTGRECAYAALAGELDAMDCVLLATKRTDSAHEFVRASVARSRYELQEAARLVEARYSWRGYLASNVGHNDRCSVTLIAESRGATVGTMTVGLDGPGGLLADQDYAEQVAAVRSKGRRVCELSRLALAEEADTRTVLSTLFSLAYGVAKALQDVTDVFIEVNPRHVSFYRRVFGFVVDAGERVCERVQAPAVLLRSSVDDLEARLRLYCNSTAKDVASSAARLRPAFA